MKLILVSLMSFFSISVFSSNEAVCINAGDCEELSALPSEFNNPEVTGSQAANAYSMAEEVLSDIGRSIAGEIEEE